MHLQVTVRHANVNDGIKAYVEGKFRKLERRLPETVLVEVVLDRERNPKIADDHVVEAEIHLKGKHIVGREAATTYEAATDLLLDKLERQVERQRDKRVHERRREAARLGHAPPVPVERIVQELDDQAESAA